MAEWVTGGEDYVGPSVTRGRAGARDVEKSEEQRAQTLVSENRERRRGVVTLKCRVIGNLEFMNYF